VSRKLIFYKLTHFCRMASLCRFCKLFRDRFKYSKNSAKTFADWTFTRLGYMLVSVLPIAIVLHSTRKRDSFPSQRVCVILPTGMQLIPAQMCAWNRLGNIGGSNVSPAVRQIITLYSGYLSTTEISTVQTLSRSSYCVFR